MNNQERAFQNLEFAGEGCWRKVAEEMLIAAYVPESDQLSYDQALQIALERDEAAARQLATDVLQSA